MDEISGVSQARAWGAATNQDEQQSNLGALLGAPVGQNGRATRVTVDGGSVMEVGNGGSALGFSQEAVQEFQVSTVNFDLSTGSSPPAGL